MLAHFVAMTDYKEMHMLNAYTPIDSNLWASTFFSETQWSNAKSPMIVTCIRFILCNIYQFLKQRNGTLLVKIWIIFKLKQPLKQPKGRIILSLDVIVCNNWLLFTKVLISLWLYTLIRFKTFLEKTLCFLVY
jgi:hypothetical protein